MNATPTTIRARINPAALTWVREVGGYSPSAFARKAGVSETRLDDWEQGRAQPTHAQLATLANAVKRPLAVFYLRQLPTEPEPPADMRYAPSADKDYPPELLLEMRRARYMARQLSHLREEIVWAQQPGLPTFALDQDAESCAERLRTTLGISVDAQTKARSADDLMNLWRDALFDIGVLTPIFSAPETAALGFALSEAGVPVAAVNSKRSVTSRLFTLFHEVCHLCLRTQAVSDAGDVAPETENVGLSQSRLELFCNQVAGAVLLPAHDQAVASALRGLATGATPDAQDVWNAARRFRVSRYVLLRRLRTLGYLPEASFWQTQRRWLEEDARSAKPRQDNQTEGGPTFYITRVSHVGRKLAAKVLEAAAAGRISGREAAEIVGVKETQLPKVAERLQFAGWEAV